MTIPSAMMVLYFGNTWLGLMHFLMNFIFFNTRYCLLLHVASHRALFKPEYSVCNYWITHVLCNFFGLPPGVYYLHHCVMHHVENNVFPWDVSSTEPYQRDNFLHFLFYW